VVEIDARKDAYRQNLREVVAKHPELLQLLEERRKLGERYEALHRKVFGAKPAAEPTAAGAPP
jgi:hypothetical protein